MGNNRISIRLRIVSDKPSPVEELVEGLRPAIPMDRALLCLDCESIFKAAGTQRCPACGSGAAWAIGRALNRNNTERRVS